MFKLFRKVHFHLLRECLPILAVAVLVGPEFRNGTFGQSAFLVKIVGKWNSAPKNIRDLGRFAVFKDSFKLWVKPAPITAMYSPFCYCWWCL